MKCIYSSNLNYFKDLVLQCIDRRLGMIENLKTHYNELISQKFQSRVMINQLHQVLIHYKQDITEAMYGYLESYEFVNNKGEITYRLVQELGKMEYSWIEASKLIMDYITREIKKSKINNNNEIDVAILIHDFGNILLSYKFSDEQKQESINELRIGSNVPSDIINSFIKLKSVLNLTDRCSFCKEIIDEKIKLLKMLQYEFGLIQIIAKERIIYRTELKLLYGFYYNRLNYYVLSLNELKENYPMCDCKSDISVNYQEIFNVSQDLLSMIDSLFSEIKNKQKNKLSG